MRGAGRGAAAAVVGAVLCTALSVEYQKDEPPKKSEGEKKIDTKGRWGALKVVATGDETTLAESKDEKKQSELAAPRAPR